MHRTAPVLEMAPEYVADCLDFCSSLAARRTPQGGGPVFDRVLKRFRVKIRRRDYVMTVQAEEEMDHDGLTIVDVERAVIQRANCGENIAAVKALAAESRSNIGRSALWRGNGAPRRVDRQL